MSAGVPRMSGTAIQELALLRANLNKLARIRSQVAKAGAQGITNQIHADTSSGLDCYGKPFAPLKPSTLAKGRRPPPMVATGASLDATRAKPLAGAGIAVDVGGAYEHHLRKTKNREARQVVPVRAGLPASWNRRLKLAEEMAVKRACPEVAS